MKKIVLIGLAVIMALGSLGVGYAMWSDTVTIDGTVETGVLELGIVKMSADLIQTKDVATVDISYEGLIGPWQPPCANPPGALANAWEKAIVTIDKAYPCLTVDLEGYVGSLSTIPMHIVSIAISDPTGQLTWQPTPADPSWTGFFYVTGDVDKVPIIKVEIINLVSTQLEGECDTDKFDLILHVEQPAEQDHTYNFEVVITGQQWDE
jgi:predicted ribosomally synthesized peptide with SipW-like signal peptide